MIPKEKLLNSFKIIASETLTPFLFPPPPPNLFRTYAIRRIRDAFRENKNVKDPVEIQTLVNKAKRDLGMIRRQVRQFNDVLFLIKSLKL